MGQLLDLMIDLKIKAVLSEAQCGIVSSSCSAETDVTAHTFSSMVFRKLIHIHEGEEQACTNKE